MYTIDINNLINNIKFNGNIFKFNNSLCHFKDNIYLMTYRYICTVETHPWNLWNCTTSNYFKYKRNYLIKERNIHLNNYEINHNCVYDSTGLVILKIINPNTYEILYDIPKLFGNVWNHDTRIIKLKNKYYFTYNSFFKKNKYEKIRCVMLKCEFNLNLENKILKLYDEKFINLNISNRLTEKNWIMLSENITEYSIEPCHKIIINNKFVNIKFNLIYHLKKMYKHKIYYSLSTPILKFNNFNLGIGHCKINYRHNYENTNFQKFKDEFILNNKNYMHGHLIYFMYFYAFDNNYNIIYMSDAFIPSYKNDYIPYFLVFPIGFTKYTDDIYIISYGEGDVRCKLLYMHKQEIVDLLKPINNKFELDFKIFSNIF